MHLTQDLDAGLQDYLFSQKWISDNEKVLYYQVAGQGNMNFVARVVTSKGSFILKQSRPYVEKYQQVAAPIERIEVERDFYKAIYPDALLSKMSPKVLGFDVSNHILALEDLGKAADFTNLYSGKRQIEKEEIDSLIDYLLELHQIKVIGFPSNDKMKALNHEHIFRYPFMEENGFDLDSVQLGLQNLAMAYKTDYLLKEALEKLGNRYLTTGEKLLHGDYYPASWLNSELGLKVIDPEFGFKGDAEFDLGVMLAHFKMAEVSDDLVNYTKETYLAKSNLDIKLLNQYSSVEILRRLIGLAQLPLTLSLEKKENLCQEAAETLKK
ncbi:MAG: phosphotransferase [Cytophagales bacterium]|nr:phosphotransferase [Cytophagales bacterium]